MYVVSAIKIVVRPWASLERCMVHEVKLATPRTPKMAVNTATTILMIKITVSLFMGQKVIKGETKGLQPRSHSPQKMHNAI